MAYKTQFIDLETLDFPDTIVALNADEIDMQRRTYVPEEELESERAENGWAREFLNNIARKCGTKDCPSLVAYVNQIEHQNDELQDLCYELLYNLMPELCGKAYWCRDKDWQKCEDYECGNFTFVILARELGIDA